MNTLNILKVSLIVYMISGGFAWAACRQGMMTFSTGQISVDTVDGKAVKDASVTIPLILNCRASPGGAVRREEHLRTQPLGNNAGTFYIKGFGKYGLYKNSRKGGIMKEYGSIPCPENIGCKKFEKVGGSITVHIKKGDTVNHGQYEIFKFRVKIGKPSRKWNRIAILEISGSNKPSPASCSFSNKGSALVDFKTLQVNSGTKHKYFDANIYCNKPTSFTYRLFNATPQITSLPLEVNDDKYLGVGLGVVNGALWVSHVNKTLPEKLVGKLSYPQTKTLRINTRVNPDIGRIASGGGVMNGSAILEIRID